MKTKDAIFMDRKESTEGCVILYFGDIEVDFKDHVVENHSHVQEYE